MKGSRDRTADREAYRNSPVWENMRRESEAQATSGTDDSRDCSGSRPWTTYDGEHIMDDLDDHMWVGFSGGKEVARGSLTEVVTTLHPDLPPGVNPEDVPS